MNGPAETINPAQLRVLLPAEPEISAQSLGHSPVQIDAYADYGPAELAVPALDHHFLLLQVAGTTRFTQKRSGKTFECDWRPGDLGLMPAGRSSQWAWTSPTGTLQLYIPAMLTSSVIEDATGMDCSRIELMDRFRFDDPLLRELGIAMRAELSTGSLLGPTYLASLTNALVLRLVTKHSAFGVRSVRTQERRLPADRLRRVRELIEERMPMHAPLSLSELAAASGYSVHHFARLFKASTGMTPHCYIQDRRMERARRLLASTRLSIKQIADACGYSDQGHFCRVFKASFGLPPSAAREHNSKIIQE